MNSDLLNELKGEMKEEFNNIDKEEVENKEITKKTTRAKKKKEDTKDINKNNNNGVDAAMDLDFLGAEKEITYKNKSYYLTTELIDKIKEIAQDISNKNKSKISDSKLVEGVMRKALGLKELK